MAKQQKFKTITDPKLRIAQRMVDQVIEPQFKKIVVELNKSLESKGIRAGVECQWFFDEIDNQPITPGEDSDED